MVRRDTTKTKEDTAPKDEEVKEESTEQEVKVVEKEIIVEKPIEVSDMSQIERSNLRAEMDRQDIEDHLKSEKKRIESSKCPVCKKNLGLKAEEYQNNDNKNKVIECSSCEQLIKVTVRYPGPIENTKADIDLKPRGYAWETQQPGTWQDKHVIKYIEAEKERLEENRSTLSEDEKKLFRVQLLTLKKLKVIK